MARKIIAFLLTIILGVSFGLGLKFGVLDNLNNKAQPDDEDVLPLENNYFEKIDAASTIYVIRNSALNDDEMAMIISLQGIVAQTAPSIYISSGFYDNYLETYKQNGYTLCYSDDSDREWTAFSLVNKFKDYIKDDGFVLFNKQNDDVGINMAATVSAVEGWISLPSTLYQNAIDNGLVLKKDLTLLSGTRIEIMQQIFDEYKDKLNKNLLVHQKESNSRLRDIGIQQKVFTFFTKETTSEKAFRKTILEWANANAPIFGWTDDEIGFVSDISKTGKFIIAMDHAINCSYLFGARLASANQKYQKRIDLKNIDTSKHYLSIVVSDGDNIQWVQGGFSTLTERLNTTDIDFPITWTYPPMLGELGSVVTTTTYQRATINDYFIAGVSGIGYMNPMGYPLEYMQTFAEMTAKGMKDCDLSIVTILDHKVISESLLKGRLRHYSNQESIKGGILEIGNRYEEGRGKIYKVSGKPFMSVRISLWNPDTNDSKNIRKDWLKQQAEMINSFKRDATSQEGYTIVNVHPWTMTIENLKYFVSFLDDDVAIVSAEEIIEIATLKLV